MLLVLALLACTAGPESKEDADGDGLLSSVDCDDNDAGVGLPSTFYGDGDGDGYGAATISVEECAAPSGFVDNAEDCDDGDALISPVGTEHCDGVDENCDSQIDEDPEDPGTYFTDSDGDGFGDPDSATVACEAPAGTVPTSGDCDDSSPSIFPGTDEHCDGVDENCDGTVDNDPVDGSIYYQDSDADGYGGAEFRACTQPTDAVRIDGDCDDSDGSIHPDGTEVCNGLDDNCDGSADNEAVDRSSFYLDADADGQGDPAFSTLECSLPSGYSATADDCDDSNPGIYTGAPEHCDRVDEDCDGATDNNAVDFLPFYADTDEDSFGNPNSSIAACEAPAGFVADNTDCDDSSAAVRPGADEYCNGADDDCDGSTDENDALDAPLWYTDADGDSYGDDATATPACSRPAGLVETPGDCDDADAAHSPATPEHCDGLDENCDGVADDNPVDPTAYYLDADADGFGDAATLAGACTPPADSVGNGDDCDDSAAGSYPGAPEHCDGVDEDCDGSVDNTPVDPTAYYLDADSDGHGDAATLSSACTPPAGSVGNGDDCDDQAAGTYPGAPEHCDGLDEDCDGSVDNAPVDPTAYYLDADADGYGDPATGAAACTPPGGSVLSGGDCNDQSAAIHPGATERCDGVDEDCDGSVDDSATGGSTWYADSDGDGYGNASVSTTACTQPSGYVVDNTDCNDASAAYTTTCNTACATLNTYHASVYATGFGTAGSLGSFCSTYNAIDGDLTLDRTDLTSMAALSCLCEVSGDVSITNNTALTTLSGLENLGSIGGDLSIENNDRLPDYTGLSGLTTVTGIFTVGSSNALMTDMVGLDALLQVGSLKLTSTPLTSLDGLESLETIDSLLYLYGNESLVSLEGLQSLRTVGGQLYMYNNDLLPSLTGLDALETVGSTLTINGVDGIPDLHPLAQLRSVGALAVSGCDLIPDLTGLEGLTSIAGGMAISQNNVQTSMEGLNNLVSVGGNVSVVGQMLDNLVGLDSLSTVGGDLTLGSSSYTMTSYQGLETLTSVGGSVYLTNGPINLQGLNALSSVGRDLSISGSTYTSMSGLDSLTTVGRAFQLSNTGYAATTNGLQQLQTVGDSLSLYNVTDTTGMTGVQTIGASLSVIGTGATYSGFSSLTSVGGGVRSLNGSCVGLSALRTIGGQLYLEYGDTGAGLNSLQSVGSLYASNTDPTAITLSSVTGGVTLENPPTVTSLNQLTSIGGNLLIFGSFYGSYFPSITGFQNLQSVGGMLQIYYADAMTSITGMSRLRTVGGEIYIYTSLLNDLSGLSSLQTIGGLRMLSTRVTNFNNFASLRTINGNLDIQGQGLLTDVTGLHGVTSITGNVTFGYNGLTASQVNTLIQTIGTSHIGGTITNND